MILFIVHVSRESYCLYHHSLCFQLETGPEEFMGFNISASQFFSISDALQMVKEYRMNLVWKSKIIILIFLKRKKETMPV